MEGNVATLIHQVRCFPIAEIGMIAFPINLLEFSFEYGIKILFKRAGKCLKYAKFAEKDPFSAKPSVIPTKPPRKNGGPTCSK